MFHVLVFVMNIPGNGKALLWLQSQKCQMPVTFVWRVINIANNIAEIVK